MSAAVRALEGRRRANRMLVAVLALSFVSGCSPLGSAPDDGRPTPAASAPGAPAPASIDELDLSAEVYRTRSDPASNGVQLVVHNDGITTLTIVSARLDSAALADPWLRERRTVISPGQSRDLALQLGDAACPADTVDPLGVLEVMLANGEVVELALETTDRLGQWAAWIEQECFAAAVHERIAVTVERDASLDGPGTIGVALRLDGLSGAREVTVAGVRGTVLLSLIGMPGDAASDANTAPGDTVTRRMLDVSVDEGRSASIPLVMAPTRCDPHALADDKQGTLVPVEIRLTEPGSTGAQQTKPVGHSGVVIVAADAATKAELYAAITRVCGL